MSRSLSSRISGLFSSRRDETDGGRRFIVGDIHGCSRTFRALLEDELAVTATDQVYLLGDLVSKGPDSIGVLRYVEEMRANGVKVTIVRGNHEEAILRARDAGKGKLRTMLERTNNTALFDPEDTRNLDPRWERMFAESEYVVFLPDAILVHGGLDLTRPDPYADGPDIVNRRDTVYDAVAAENRTVIHGHTRSALSETIESLVTSAPVLPLDNGAVGASSRKLFKVGEYGNLCCLNLDTRTLHVQPNRDVEDDDGAPGAAFTLHIHPRPDET
ncbi:MAG: metallophosphoesterase [Spirochaeta sp.]|nr:metallophosphoesterase [Spirochaeta sp.]